MATAVMKDLTRMIEELSPARQGEVRDFIERLLKKSRRQTSAQLRPREDAAPLSEANRRMLGLLERWKSEPISREEPLDDFEEFQRQHPLRFSRLDEGP